MSKNCHKILPETKAQILSELQAPGCIVSKLAKAHNVSSTSIYTWQRQAREAGIEKYSKVDREDKFVELEVADSKNSTLEKASLIFNDFSLIIEGRVKSSSLIAIIDLFRNSTSAGDLCVNAVLESLCTFKYTPILRSASPSNPLE